MNNTDVFNYVQDWLERRRIKSFFGSKKSGKQKYIKIKEDDLYELCSKLISLVKNNLE